MIDAEMYGTTPRAKSDRRSERAAREHVEHVDDRALLLLDQAQHGGRIDAGHRDEGAQAEDDHRADHEQQALLELGQLAEARKDGLALARSPLVLTPRARRRPRWPHARRR
jgi:hypothetical protein